MQLTKIIITLVLIMAATSPTTINSQFVSDTIKAPNKIVEKRVDSLEMAFNKKIDSATEILNRIEVGQQVSKTKVYEVQQLIKKLLRKKTVVVVKTVPVVVRDTIAENKYPYTEKTFTIKIDSAETKRHFFLSRWWNNIFKRKK